MVGVATRQPAKAVPVEKEVQLRVLLPDKSVTTFTIHEFWRTGEVFEVRVDQEVLLLCIYTC